VKQILQNLGSGETVLADVPCPKAGGGALQIATSRSLVSLGTEKMLLDFGKGNLLDKARQQPEKVKQVLHKVKTDGLAPTLEAVRAKLDQPIPLGYSNVGVVAGWGGSEVAVGDEAASDGPGGPDGAVISAGTRVVSNGPHAEMVAVPRALCAAVPEVVTDDEAAFTVVGAIGLQGIRLIHPTLGERVVVTGLGLIGLMCVQMLRAHGCPVLGIDFDGEKLALARKFGAETVDLSKGQDPVRVAMAWTGSAGVDAVLITASTKSDDVVHQAAGMCRKRGRIVLVGVTGLKLQRSDFYEKELTFQVSCSYGPGRYDPNYERKGLDYPIGFVRWTEQRNFEAVLQLMAEGKLDVNPLITHRLPFDRALEAYEVVGGGKALGIILEYDERNGARGRRHTGSGQEREEEEPRETQGTSPRGDRGSKVEDPTSGTFARTVTLAARGAGSPAVSFIGAGNFTTRVLLPALRGLNCRLKAVVSSSGVSSTHAARKFGFEQSSSDSEAVFSDEEVDAVFVTTPHNTHARLVCRAIEAGKHVFVEKPLCITSEELQGLKGRMRHEAGGTPHEEGGARQKMGDREEPPESANADPPAAVGTPHAPILMVGFNRRFSPHTARMRELLSAVREPLSVMITVNAGAIPGDHWVQDPEVGGGRVIGEACHFVDLARFLVGSPIVGSSASYLGGESGKLGDTVTLSLRFENESIAAVHYLSTGHKGFPKERVEVFAGGKVLQCDNFRVTRGWGWQGFSRFRTRSQDKGHAAEVAAFIRAVREGGPPPIPVEEILEVTEVTLTAGRVGLAAP